MAFRVGAHVVAAFMVASLVWSAGCNGDDEDDCVSCCECSNDGSPLVYRPDAPGDCSSCKEQCQALADRDFMGQEFDVAKKISCPD
jgi:hypothetical protein